MSHYSSSMDGLGVEFHDLLQTSPDPYYDEPKTLHSKNPLAFLKATDPSKSSEDLHEDMVVQKLRKLKLDITRISDRLLVIGRCWNYRTDQEACRNNIEEVACFLNARYERNYLIFNFGSPDVNYDTVLFRNQVVAFPISRMLTLSLKMIFDACRAMTSWLRLSKENVVVVQCKNGKSRSGLVMACLLRYSGLFDSVHEGLEYFRMKRSPDDSSWITVTLKRYIRYFNDVLILEGRLPSSIPLKLHQIILTTIPDFNGVGGCNPGIEVFQEGRLVYSSAIRQVEIDNDSTETQPDDDNATDEQMMREFRISLILQPGQIDQSYNPIVMHDAHNIIFRLENISLERDVQVRVYHRNQQAAHNVTIFNLAFNTGFMAPGLVRLRTSDLEIPLGSAERFDADFAVDLVITPDEEKKHVVSYESSMSKSFVRDLMKLSRIHSVRSDPALAKPLELQGHRKFFVKLALQLGNNDIHAAHEFLSYLSKSPKYHDLDRELSNIAKTHHENMTFTPAMSLQQETETNAEEEMVKQLTQQPNSCGLKNPSDEHPRNVATIQSASNYDGSPFSSERSEVDTEEKFQVKQVPIRNVDSQVKAFPASSDRAPLFVADILKVAGSRKDTVSQHTNQAESIKEKASRLPPFLAGLEKITSNRRKLGELPEEDTSAETKPDLCDPASVTEPLLVSNKYSFVINAGIPEAPPLPAYLAHSRSKIPSAPPLPDHLRHGNSGTTTTSKIPSAPPLPPKFLPKKDEKRHRVKNTLHWGEIRDEKQIRNTIWLELQETDPMGDRSLDVHRFEEMFCVGPQDESRTISKASENQEKSSPRILDSRRANNVGIGLSRFYKRMSNVEIVNSVVYHKHLLDINDLLCLKAILPTDEERQQLQLYRGDLKLLSPAEQFMQEMSKAPSISWMIDSLIFEAQFQVEFDSISKKLTSMTATLIKIRESPGLKALFRLVLELGNLTNYDYGRVPAHMRIRGKALGFTMDSLLKLHEVRSVDKKSTLLNYLLATITEKNSELLVIPSEFSEMSTVKHWDSQSLASEIDNLKLSLSRAANLGPAEGSPDASLVDSFRESQAAFISLAQPKLEKLVHQNGTLHKAWLETAQYLGEDPQEKRPEELFIVFDQFFRQFKDAYEQNIKASKHVSRSPSKSITRVASLNDLTSQDASSSIPSRFSSPAVSEINTETTIEKLDL